MRYRRRSILCTECAHEQVELLAVVVVVVVVVVMMMMMQLSRLVFIRRLRFLR